MSDGRIVSCPACGRKNRIPWVRFGQAARCGACHGAVMPADAAVPLNDRELEAIVATVQVPVFVDFWAPWCGPCAMVAPEVEALAKRAAGRFVVVKVDTDRASATAAQHRIRSIPTFAVFFRGREIARTSGARSADALERFVLQSVGERADTSMRGGTAENRGV